MHVLDLDLDFFADCTGVYKVFSTDRVPSEECGAWTEEDVRTFLEKQCGLSPKRRVRGRVITHHHEAFDFWKELIEQGKLITPFEVTHVDAHADLGLWDSGYEYLMTDILHRDLPDRSSPEVSTKHMNPGNYLPFAIANRWISKLSFVPNSMWSEKQHDLLKYHFKDEEIGSGAIQLKAVAAGAVDDLVSGRIKRFAPITLEPEVPFELIKSLDYQATQEFDFIVLALSPGFTSVASDKLIPVILEYIEQI